MTSKSQQIDALNQANSLISYLSQNNSLSSDDVAAVNSISAYLKNCGLGKNSKLAIIANTRKEWVLADLATMSIGGVSVSVYQSLTPAEMAFILYDSGTDFIFVENQEQLLKINTVLNNEWNIPKIEDRNETKINITTKGIITFEKVSSDELEFKYIYDLDSNNNPKIEFDDSVNRSDLASIVYTSGTTGPPKGVMQTHGNHLSNIRQVLESGLMLEQGSLFLFLPLAHSFAKLMSYVCLFSELKLVYPTVVDSKTSKLDSGQVAKDLKNANSDIIPVVPRFLEKIKEQIEHIAHKKTFSGLLIRLSIITKQRLRKRRNIFNYLISGLFSPIRNKIKARVFGNNFKYCVSGGAKLPTNVHYFFDNLDITIVQGYGLTETCVATNACRPNNNKIGSVGPVLAKDIEIKICEDQEIAFRGPNNSIGYLGRPKATAEAWTTDGWFLTGDQGRLDEDGFLYITGRKKELIATSGGKKIPPLPIEEEILKNKIFTQAVLIGEGRKYLSAIVCLNKLEVEKLLNKNFDSCSLEELINLSYKYINELNKSLASYESIKKIIISPFEFSTENGFLTPSMKLKRNLVETHFKNEINALYAENE